MWAPHFEPINIESHWEKLRALAALFWIAVLCGFLAMTPMLVAMTPLLGSAEQESLRTVHEYAGLALAVVLALYVVIAARAARARR